MEAEIRVQSYTTSIWSGLQRQDCQDATYLLEEGECIQTLCLGVEYSFMLADVLPKSAVILVSPALLLTSSGRERSVGSLSLEIGDTAELRTMSFDAWGSWLVSLEGIA